MLTFNDLRKGKGRIILLDGQPYTIVSADFLRKQQRRPTINATLKHLKTNQTKEHTFQQSDKVQEADVVKRPHQFLYVERDQYIFMNTKTFEQVEISAENVGDVVEYLLEGQEAAVVLLDNVPVSVELPIKIERTVIEAPPGVRGDTSTNVTKDIVIEGGVTMKAPLFVKEGDVIRLDTRTGEYLERG